MTSEVITQDEYGKEEVTDLETHFGKWHHWQSDQRWPEEHIDMLHNAMHVNGRDSFDYHVHPVNE